MSEEILVLVKIPIRPLAENVRTRNHLTEELFDVKLEGDHLVLLFKRTSQGNTQPEVRRAESLSRVKIHDPARAADVTSSFIAHRVPRKRRMSKRNRMRTRGWQVVAKVTNSKGQIGVVYKPFVQALFGKMLTPAQQRNAVADILRSNGNEPTEASIEYFLLNTLEYLKQVNKTESGA